MGARDYDDEDDNYQEVEDILISSIELEILKDKVKSLEEDLDDAYSQLEVADNIIEGLYEEIG